MNADPADVAPAQRAGPHLNPCGVGALPPTELFLERLLFVADLRLHLQSSTSTNSPPCHFVTSLLSTLSRAGKSRGDKVVSLLRRMLQGVRSKSATNRSPFWKSSASGKAPTPQGFKCGPVAARWCNVRRSRFQAKPARKSSRPSDGLLVWCAFFLAAA